MALNTERHQKKFSRILASFPGRFMTDTKWTKVFTALASHSDLIKRCLVKDVFDNYLREIQIPQPVNYSGTFHTKGIKDVSGGPAAFKEIEQLLFPRMWTIERRMRTEILEPYRYQQDIDKIKEIIDSAGEFEMEIDGEVLILYGYR